MDDGSGEFTYIWIKLAGEVPRIDENVDPIHTGGDYLRPKFRRVGFNELPQIVSGNVNGDSSRFPVLIVGQIPVPSDEFTVTWKYYNTPNNIQDPPPNETYYVYVKNPGPGNSRITRITNYGGGNIERTPIFVQNTRAREVTDTWRLHGWSATQETYTLEDTSFSDTGNGIYPRLYQNGFPYHYEPDEILVFADGIKPSPREWQGCAQYQNDDGTTQEIFVGTQMMVEDDPDLFTDSDFPMPNITPGMGEFLNESNEPFLIFRNPETLPGNGPVWRWFQGQGWQLIVEGIINRVGDEFRARIGSPTGSYEDDFDGSDYGDSPPSSGFGVRRPPGGGTTTSTQTDYYDYNRRTWNPRTPNTQGRSTQTNLPDPNSPGMTPGYIFVITPEERGRPYDYTNRREPDGRPGSGGSTTPNYDNSNIYIIIINENGEREWRHAGTAPDTTDRENVTNRPSGLNIGDTYIFNDSFVTVENRSGATNYTNINSVPVPPPTDTVPPSTAPPPNTHTGTRPTDPPNPPEGSRYENGPFQSVGTNVVYGDQNINNITNNNYGDNIDARNINITTNNIYNSGTNNFFWFGNTDPNSPSPSATEGSWTSQNQHQCVCWSSS